MFLLRRNLLALLMLAHSKEKIIRKLKKWITKNTTLRVLNVLSFATTGSQCEQEFLYDKNTARHKRIANITASHHKTQSNITAKHQRRGRLVAKIQTADNFIFISAGEKKMNKTIK